MTRQYLLLLTRYTKVLLCIVEYHTMQFAPMPIEVRRFHGILWCRLIYDNLPCVILVDIEAILPQVDL